MTTSSQYQAAGASGRIVVWGAGGHAKVAADILRLNGFEIAGFLDQVDPQRLGESFCGARVLGGPEVLRWRIRRRNSAGFRCFWKQRPANLGGRASRITWLSNRLQRSSLRHGWNRRKHRCRLDHYSRRRCEPFHQHRPSCHHQHGSKRRSRLCHRRWCQRRTGSSAGRKCHGGRKERVNRDRRYDHRKHTYRRWVHCRRRRCRDCGCTGFRGRRWSARQNPQARASSFPVLVSSNSSSGLPQHQ